MMSNSQIAEYILSAIEDAGEVTEEDVRSIAWQNPALNDVIDEMILAGYVESTIVKTMYGRFLPALRRATSRERIAA